MITQHTKKSAWPARTSGADRDHRGEPVRGKARAAVGIAAIACLLAAAGPAASADDLWPSWRIIDLLEQHGQMDATKAGLWKEGIYWLMVHWGLGPEDLIAPVG